ncbi:MAG: hypothetical protein KBB32_01695 [Spirochaetia bacterium]|nr:hypothetical protein [Spirochaetia bacterium]
MDITVNGKPTSMAEGAANLAEILGVVDERLEAAGLIITALSLNGAELDADRLSELAHTPADGPGTLDVRAESVSAFRTEAIRTLLALLDSASKAGPEALPALRLAWSTYRTSFSGLHSAEELSFLDAFGTELDSGLADASGSAGKLMSFFGERLSEVEDPLGSLRSASRLFAGLAPDLAEVPVRMQTGKDPEAIRTMMLTVELINKIVRVLPDVMRLSPEVAALKVGDAALADFFDGFNKILRELAGAFEAKDGVLIGDLAEYEILPRLESLFAALDGVLP